MSDNSSAKRKWFWAWLIQMTVPKGALNVSSGRTEVWKNLVIVSAENPDEAFQKAAEIGKSESGDCRGTLRLYGKPAMTRFLGIADMGLVYDDLDDGAEILWQLKRCSQKTARSLVTSKRSLISRLKIEMSKSVR